MKENDIRKTFDDMNKAIEKKADLVNIDNLVNEIEKLKGKIEELNKNLQVQTKILKDEIFSLETKVALQ